MVTLFILLQVADALEPLGFGARSLAVMLVVGVAGFPVVLVLAWMFDLTDEGVRQAEPGPLADLLGGTPVRRSATVFFTALLSVGLGWGAWEVWLGTRTELPGSPEFAALDPRRIGVLYLDDYSEDGSLGYLAAALTEGLVHELSTVEGLRVASRSAVKVYRNSEVPLDSIVRALEVGSLVEGSVTQAGDRIRATVQLIDGETLEHLDSQVIEGSLDDPFAFQDSLTSTVTRALRRRLGQEIRIRAARKGTDDPVAWTAYARGNDEVTTYLQLREVDQEGAMRALERADSLFALAESQDGTWLQAVVRRAWSIERKAALRAPLPGALDTTLAAVADSILGSALRRDPAFAEALAQRGQLRMRLARTPGVPDPNGLLEEGEADVRAALRIKVDLPDAWWTLSEVLVRQGRFEEAVEAAERALAADAFLEVEGEALWSLAYAVLQRGPDDQVIRLCDEGRRRFPESANFVWCRFVILGAFPQVEPDVDHAHALFDSLLAASPDASRDVYRDYGTVWLARVAARAGMADSARAMLDRVREPGETPSDLAYDEAHVQVLLGDRAEAVRLLGRYLAEESDTAFVRSDWWFEGLRDYPPFRKLVGLVAGGR